MTTSSQNSRPAAPQAGEPVRDVIVVGAGFAGIGAAIELKKAGFDYLLLEKASEVGGVWRENTYPNCACDVPSTFYSYSFAPKPDWNHFFAHQKEIKQYAIETARRFGLMDSMRFGHELLEARWRADEGLWELRTSGGDYRSRFVVMASGPMHVPVIPKLHGLEGFPGNTFHSARWDHDADLRGKRVAVIGTGASAIQFVPAIQREVEKMAIFQRTAPWVLPKLDAPVTQQWQQRFGRFPILQRGLRGLLYAQFEYLNWSLNRPAARKRLEAAAQKNIHRGIEDPVLRAKVTPDYAIGCKRILQSNKWYRALAKPNVAVVGGVKEIEGNTVVSSDGTRFEADVIVFATGFQVANPPIAERIVGLSGNTLAEQWKGSPEAFLGTTVPDCPNCFLALGPNLYAFSSAFVMIEAQMKYILSVLDGARKKNIATVNVKPGSLSIFNRLLQSALDTTVFNRGGCTSYFIDRTGRNSTNWPWTTFYLRKRLRRVDWNDYDAVAKPGRGA